MSKNKVGKGREGKERKGKGRKGRILVGIFTHLWGKWGGVIITKFYIRVNAGYVMIFAIFGVDILRDADSVRG